MELEKEFGAKVWQQNLTQQDHTVEAYANRNRTVQADIVEINKKRKFSQLNLTDPFLSQMAKISECRQSNLNLECEIARIELECLSRGVKRARLS